MNLIESGIAQKGQRWLFMHVDPRGHLCKRRNQDLSGAAEVCATEWFACRLSRVGIARGAGRMIVDFITYTLTKYFKLHSFYLNRIVFRAKIMHKAISCDQPEVFYIIWDEYEFQNGLKTFRLIQG